MDGQEGHPVLTPDHVHPKLVQPLVHASLRFLPVAVLPFYNDAWFLPVVGG